MKAVAWHGKRDVRVDNVEDPTIQEPTDAIVRITTTAICGSDLHLYEFMGAFLDEGDILGHEPMGIVEAVGSAVTGIAPGDRVVIPFNVSCGHCWMCERNLQSQCETTQNHEWEKGASLLGYTKLYGQVPGGQAEYLRVPHADYGPVKVPHGPSDDRFVYLSDVLPTAWQAVAYADVPDDGTLGVLGLGPIGDMCGRIGLHQGKRVIAFDLVPERIERAKAQGMEAYNLEELDDPTAAVLDMTGGRGPDSVIDAVGMEAHGSTAANFALQMTTMLPDAIVRPIMQRMGTDRMSALLLAIDMVRRGGTISLSGVYGGETDPMPMFTLFDKQVQLRMGQANVRAWTDDILPLLTGDDDPLGVEDFATHRLPLDDAPDAYERFQKKDDGMVKVLLKPEG
ncbi:MAG TPA: zinc-dependent alcohol dehydrogenase [Thermoleophilaceae bacterium]|jgi:threonine dehydrogenase-like Zn-dependent dehydrogenase